MAASLARPGVEIIQQFRTATPSVITPTLVPVVVGVCKQIVNVVQQSAAGASELNTQANVQLGASAPATPAGGAPPAYTGLDGLSLVVSVKNSPDITVEFDGNSLSPASVVAQINDQLLAVEVSEMVAQLTDSTSWRLRTIGVGPFEQIEIRPGTDPAVLATFGWVIGTVYTGRVAYSQTDLSIPFSDFPDPNKNLDELVVEPATVKVYLSLGEGLNLKEISRTEAFLRRGGADNAARLEGTVAASTVGLYGGAGTLAGTSLSLTVDSALAPLVVSMGTGGSAVADAYDLAQRVNAAAGYALASVGTGIVVTSPTAGSSSNLTVAGTAAALLGFAGATATSTGSSDVSFVDDGNGDALTSLVRVAGEDFTAPGTAASLVGVAPVTSLTYPADVEGKTITLEVDGKAAQTLTLTSIANQAGLLAALAAFFPTLVPSLSGSNLALTTTATGGNGIIRVVGGTALGTLGLVPSVLTSIDLTNISPDLTALNTRKLRVVFPDGVAEVTFSGLTGGSTPADVATFLNGQAVFSSKGVASIESNKLRVRASKGGAAGAFPLSVSIEAASSLDASTLLGFNPGQTGTFSRFDGLAFPPRAGDDFYVDGELAGRIAQVAPGGAVDTLKLDKQFPINAAYGSLYWIRARSLSAGLVNRPIPELVVDGSGIPSLSQDLLRDVNGVPQVSQAPIYLSYRAIRQDVTARAFNPALLRVSSTSDLEALLSPINSENPLALGMYFALLNAPGSTISGIGIDAVSADSPYGTVEAFTRAAEFLETYDVYALAPLTNDQTVAQVYNAHVLAMSAPAAKMERMAIFNFKRPTSRLDKLVASGLSGNSIGNAGLQFDTSVSNLTALLQNAGVNPTGTIPAEQGVFLDIASDAKRYNVASINGGIVTIRTAFTAGQNDDGFYATSDLNDPPNPPMLINEPFALRVRGASLTRPDGSPDKLGMAETFQELAQTYASRRLISLVADGCGATVGGLEQALEGFYLCAAKAGMIGGQAPQQSFTNFPMVGFTRVMGTNDFFSETQLGIIAAGGNDIIVQDTEGAPLISRFALTTDMSSIETRTDSINRVVDFSAKFIRRALKNYIGRFNITQGFIDSLSNVIQGLIGFLVDTGVLIGGSLNNIVQDEDAPDTILADVTLDVPYPCNFIRLTLTI